MKLTAFLLFISVTCFGQFTKPQLYNNINTSIRSGRYLPKQVASLLDSIVATMNTGGGYTFSNGLTESGGGVKLGGPILESTVLTTGVDEKTEVTFDSTSVSVKAEYPTHEALNTFTYSKTSFDYSSGGTNYINEYTGWDTKKGYSLSVGNATNTMLWELDLFSGLNFDNTFGTGQFNMDANFGQFKTYQQNTTSSTTIDQDFTRVQISSDSAIFFVRDDGVYIGDNVESYKMPLNVGSNGQVLTTDGAGAATWQTPTGGYTDEQAQDAVGAMVDASLTYVDGTPLLQRAALTGAITASAGSNSTSLGSFTTSQLNTALSDNDVEVAANKATSLSTLDNTLYPTTQSLFQQRSVTGTDAIVSTDNGKTIVFNSATPFNFTIDALTAGMQMGLINKGTGTVTLVAGSGVTLGGVTSLATNESAAVIYYTSTSVDAIGGGGGGGGGLTVGTSTITSGTNTRVLYNNSGVLGEYTVSGSGNVAMTTSPTFTTPILGTPTSGTLTNTTGYLFNNLAAAGGTNTINNAAHAQEWQWNTLGAGIGLLLSSSSTAAASNTNTLFRVNQTGANATSTQTTYSGYFSNTKTGTNATNVGLYATASGGTTNYAIQTLGNVFVNTGNLTVNTISGVNSLVVGGSAHIQLGSQFGNGLHMRNTLDVSTYQNATNVTLSGYSMSNTSPAVRLSSYITNTATSGNITMVSLQNKNATSLFSWSSGTAVGRVLAIDPAYNITGGTSTVYGIDYNPTLTSITGVNHIAFNSTSGNWQMQGSGTTFTLGGGAAASELRFLEPSGSGSNYSAFKAVGQSSNITYSLPSELGLGNSALIDAAGDGILTWRAANILHSNAVYGTEFVTINFGEITNSSTGSSSIHVNTYYPNKTALVARVTCVGIKTDGTASVIATITARFRKDNSGTFNLEDAGTIVTSNAAVIAGLEGEINGTNPAIRWTSGASASTYQLIANIETTWVTD